MGSIFRAKGKHDKLQQFPEWDDVKYCFVKDGALLDIRLPDIKADDFPKFFHFIKNTMDSVDYLIDDQEYELPKSYEEYQFHVAERGATLSAKLGLFTFNCHSYSEEYLEMDFWPDSVTRENFSGFLEFLIDLGRALSQDLGVSDEGSDSPAFLHYSHTTDSLFQVSENLVKKRNCVPEELRELARRDV